MLPPFLLHLILISFNNMKQKVFNFLVENEMDGEPSCNFKYSFDDRSPFQMVVNG